MLTFAYTARDAAGKTLSGTQEGLNEDNAIQSLMEKGLMVLSIKETLIKKRQPKEKSVSDTELVLFTRMLATMVDAGLPLVNALSGIHRQTSQKRQPGLRQVIENINTRVQNGESFYDATSKYPKVFNRLFVSMVKAGEIAGVLAEILDRLASFFEASARLRKKVKSAMTYPVIVICIAFCITTFLIVKVVPVFSKIFEDFHAKLPAPTQFLIDLSSFIRGEWYFIIAGMAGTFYGIRFLLETKRGSEIWDRCKIEMPVFGPLTHKICMTRFARTFAQLLRSGVPILEIIDIVGDTSGNHVVTVALKSVRADVEKGEHLTESLSKHAIFPPMMLQMVAAGEATGNIDVMLEKMADFWDEEIEATLSALTSLIEPFLITVLGVIVGGIVISMFLPIFKLNDIVSSPSGGN
ncbi:MAG: type II secretion system F family protein [Chthoniobacteraceae bacterium]